MKAAFDVIIGLESKLGLSCKAKGLRERNFSSVSIARDCDIQTF
jgi:hypothetical protein